MSNSEIFNAADSNALFAGKTPYQGDVSGPMLGFDGRRLTSSEVKVSQYNFRNPGFLSTADLRQLAVLHQKFADHLAARLSTFFRMECAVKLKVFNSSTYARFIESINPPTHIVLFQVEPLRGIGVLDLNLGLGLAMADRILGGKGRVPEPVRNLTEIENALLEDAVNVILTEWAQLWHDTDAAKLTPQIIGHDTNPRFLQTSETDAVLVTMTAEVVLGECSGVIQLGIPFAMIESIVKKMSAARLRGKEGKPREAAWRAAYDQIVVPVIADWPVREISLNEVLNLQPGDVIPLSPDLIPQTRVRFSDTPQFIGTVGVENGRIAIQLTQKSEPN